jgi:hypothetical protein
MSKAIVDNLNSGVAPKDNLKGIATHGASNRTTLQFAAILTGGFGYAVGDIITLAGGTFATAATLQVLSVNSGVITGVKILNIGRYSATTGTLTQSSTTGIGSGATFTATYASDVLDMFDTTGFNYLQFQFIGSWAYANTSVEGSLDGGVTWNSIQWYLGSFGTFSPVVGTSGSAVNTDIQYCPAPAPLTRIKDSGNNTIAWSLRNVSMQTNIVSQGRTSGSNNYWFIKPIATPFGGAGAGGGGLVAKIISTASTNALLISTSTWAATCYCIDLSNNGLTWAYLKIYNKASTPTVGTDTPVYTFGIPPNGKLSPNISDLGIWLGTGTGFSIAITGGFADLDTTAIAAGQVVGIITLN